jgi:hypothetical protein
MSEQFAVIPHEAFIAALQDAAMTMPGGLAPLFDASIYEIEPGGGESINNSNGTFSLPLSNVYIFVGIPYGDEHAYADDLTYRDSEIWVPFTVMSGTNGDQIETLRRLDFARHARSAVFAAHGLTEVSQAVRMRRLAYSQQTGIVGVQYVWRFWFGSSTTA